MGGEGSLQDGSISTAILRATEYYRSPISPVSPILGFTPTTATARVALPTEDPKRCNLLSHLGLYPAWKGIGARDCKARCVSPRGTHEGSRKFPGVYVSSQPHRFYPFPSDKNGFGVHPPAVNSEKWFTGVHNDQAAWGPVDFFLGERVASALQPLRERKNAISCFRFTCPPFWSRVAATLLSPDISDSIHVEGDEIYFPPCKISCIFFLAACKS